MTQNNFDDIYRITVYSPRYSVDQILAEIIKFDFLRVGPYQEVAWFSLEPGTEQFRPVLGANPTQGKEGVLTRETSVRLEFSIPRDKCLLEKIVSRIIVVHPWEQPVICVAEQITVNVFRE